MLCLFSYKVLFNELKCIDSVVEGTEKLLKPFLHCINNGTLECASEEVRTAVVSFNKQFHLLFTSILRNH